MTHRRIGELAAEKGLELSDGCVLDLAVGLQAGGFGLVARGSGTGAKLAKALDLL